VRAVEKTDKELLAIIADHALRSAMDCTHGPTRDKLIAIANDCLDLLEMKHRAFVRAEPTKLAS
jgi:hypothetical protein